MWPEGVKVGRKGTFGAVLGAAIDQPEGVWGRAKSAQPIGLLFGPGSSESGRDLDTCRMASPHGK
jgi:hypothetical protein